MYARAHARNVPINAKTDAVTVQIPVSPNNGACLQLHRPTAMLISVPGLWPRKLAAFAADRQSWKRRGVWGHGALAAARRSH